MKIIWLWEGSKVLSLLIASGSGGAWDASDEN